MAQLSQDQLNQFSQMIRQGGDPAVHAFTIVANAASGQQADPGAQEAPAPVTPQAAPAPAPAPAPAQAPAQAAPQPMPIAPVAPKEKQTVNRPVGLAFGGSAEDPARPQGVPAQEPIMSKLQPQGQPGAQSEAPPEEFTQPDPRNDTQSAMVDPKEEVIPRLVVEAVGKETIRDFIEVVQDQVNGDGAVTAGDALTKLVQKIRSDEEKRIQIKEQQEDPTKTPNINPLAAAKGGVKPIKPQPVSGPNQQPGTTGKVTTPKGTGQSRRLPPSAGSLLKRA